MNGVAHEQYKESGVLWLGQIPTHWEVKRIKDVSELQSGESITSQQFTDEGYPVFGGNGMRGYFSRYNHQGEYILIGRQGALCGNVNYAKGKFWASEHAVVVYKDNAVNTVWYGELLRIMNLNQYSLAAAQPGLSVDKIKRIELPFAPAAEQQAISDYIIRHTVAIDRKIDLLEQKIKLYQTLRKTLINETVCRGLNPNAPRKDSVIEWIGEIPAHWEVKRLKEQEEIIMGQSPESKDYAFDEDGFPFLQGNAEFGPYHPTPSIWCRTASKVVRPNDVLVSVRAPIGAINVANRAYGIGRGLCAIRGKKSNYRFLYYHFLARKEDLNRMGTGTTYIAISLSEIRNLLMAYPSFEEQTEIAAHLDAKTQQLDTITANLKAQITTLKELRKTLINDVVTGKINVTA